MRDLVWTLIIIWLIYKLVDFFKSNSFKKTFTGNQNEYNQSDSYSTKTSSHKKDIRGAVQNHVNKEGDYIDFEEIK
jgi:hypothetical protein